MVLKPLSKAVLQTLIYADIFDYPLRIPEIWRWLIWGADSSLSFSRLNPELKKLSLKKLMENQGSFYFLRGRKKIVGLRQKRQSWSEKKMKIARRTADYFKLIPWIKMVGVTGALAMANTDQEDDIDLLIITAPGRLWLSRLILIILTETLGVRRRPGEINPKDKICLNMFLDEDHLSVPEDERNLFTAHEVAQLKLIWSRGNLYQKFLWQNQWVKGYLKNGLGRVGEEIFPRGPSWRSIIFDWLELAAQNRQLNYMEKRRTSEKIYPGRVLFHPQDQKEIILRQYRSRLK